MLLECQNAELVENRLKYIPKYYYSRPNMIKYVQLMKEVSTNSNIAKKVGMFLKTSL